MARKNPLATKLRRIRADRRRFYAYYAWAVFVREERRTGPGRQTP